MLKKIILFALACLFIIVPIIQSAIAPVSADNVMDDLSKRMNDRRASITASANTRKELEKRIAELRNQQAYAINDKKVFDEMIAAIDFEIKESEILIEEYKELIAQEEINIADTQEEYEKNYALFLDVIKFLHEEGSANYLEILLESDSFANFLTRVDTVTNILEYNKKVINNLQQTKENLEKRKQYYEDWIIEYGEELERLAVIRKNAKEWQQTAKAAIEEAERKIQENIALQAELDREEREMQKEIERLQREYQLRQESLKKYVGGEFLWPVPISNKKISSDFGGRKSPITGRWEQHNGIDIPAPLNTDIFAANDGTVILSQYSAGYGNYIVIDHGGGKSTLYAHNNTNLKKVGDTVKRGDVIAKIGTTGWSTGWHLHFGYYEDGVPLNPLQNGLTAP